MDDQLPPLPPGDFEETAIKRVAECNDIVHGFDDPDDFRWWRPAFEVLKPTTGG